MTKEKFLISVIIALILGVTLTLLATQTWSPTWNPFGKVASLTIEDSIAKLIGAETFKITGVVEGEFQTEKIGETEAKIITASLSLSQIIDKRESEKPKSSADLNLKLGMEGIELSMKGELMSEGKDIYFKITTLPSLPFLAIDLEGIKNQWIKIDIEKLRDMTGEEKEEPLDEKAFLQDLKNTLEGKEIFKVKKNLGDEELDGVKVKHYFAEVNKEGLKVLIPEILQLTKKYLPKEEQITYEKELEEFSKNFSENFDEFWSNIKPLEFDFWIEEGSLWLRGMKFEKEIEYNSPEIEGVGQIKLGVDLKFSDFNKNIEIKIPENFKLIEELLSSEDFLPSLPESSLEEYLLPESIPEFNFSPEE